MNIPMTRREAAAQEGLSDSQLDLEHRLQKRLFAALDELCKSVLEINTYSECVKIENGAVEDFIHDYMPEESAWDEKISIARRG